MSPVVSGMSKHFGCPRGVLGTDVLKTVERNPNDLGGENIAPANGWAAPRQTDRSPILLMLSNEPFNNSMRRMVLNVEFGHIR
jgi:hypothetical protein